MLERMSELHEKNSNYENSSFFKNAHFSLDNNLSIGAKTYTQMEYDLTMIPIKFGNNLSNSLDLI